MTGLSDAALIQRAARGNQEAFEALFERHHVGVFSFAYRLVGDADVAEDITQDCFLALLRKREDFDADRASLRTYLLAIARNLAYKYFRRSRIEALYAAAPLGPPGQPDAIATSVLLREEAAQLVRDAIRTLPELEREAVVLFEYHECSLDEICVIAGCGLSAAKARLHRARQKLRELLAPYFAELDTEVRGFHD